MVEVTTDSGRSWKKTKPGLTAIVRLTSFGEESVFAIGADDRCRPTYAWINSASGSWQRDRSRARDTWFRVPEDPDRAHAPGGAESRPCGNNLMDLASLDIEQAAVLCADGRIRTTINGRSWKTVRQESGTLALNADDDRFLAARTREDCPGVLVQTFSSTGSGLGNKNGDCQSRVKAVRDKTAVAQRSASLWLWSDDHVTRG